MMSNLRNLAIALWLAIWLIPATMVSPSWGDENQTKIDLQAALLNFLDMSADQQGRFRVIDRVSGKVLHTYAGAMHPKIWIAAFQPARQAVPPRHQRQNCLRSRPCHLQSRQP